MPNNNAQQGTPAPAAAPPKKLPRKERKRQKKELRKQQIALEKKLIAEGRIPPRAKYRTRGFFWRVFSLCLAFFFGIFATVGGVIAFGLIAPVGDVVSLAGFDISSVLNEEYASQSIIDLINTIASDPFDSLAAVSKYTPLLDEYLTDFQTSLADIGVHVDLEEVKATKFDELGKYMQDNVVDTIVLGEVLGLTPADDGLILGICYGEEGTDYTVVDGKIVPIAPPLSIGDLTSEDGAESVIRKISIEQALSVTAESNAAMRFLAYGTEGTEYKIENGEIVMLENELTGETFKKKTLADLTTTGATPIENARVSDLITVESDTGILAAIKDWKISDMEDTYRIERLKISQIMDIDENSSKIAQAIAGWRLGDLTDAAKMDTLTLGEVIEIGEDSPRILRSLADTPIGEFGDAVDGLRLSDILEESDFEGNNFLKTLRMSSITSLSEDLKNLSAADVFGEEMYSYLDHTEQFDNLDYAGLFAAAQEGHKTEGTSGIKPARHPIGDDEKVRSYFVPKTDGAARLTGGYYYGDGTDGYHAAPLADVHSRKEEDAFFYYMKGEQRLEEHRSWQLVDYEEKKLTALPEGDRISTRTEGYKVMEREGTPCTENGEPLYYLTTRVKFKDGQPATGSEQVAYPLLQNSYSVYYTYLNYTPGEEGPDEFREERVDLEYALDALSYETDGGRVTFTKDEDGDWASPEGEKTSVYEHRAETDAETGDVVSPAYFYIKTETEVHYGYYAESGEIGRIYAEDEVTEKFEIVKTDEDGAVTGDPAVPVDRYLSGVWYFLFGTEKDADGNIIEQDENGNFIDNSHMPVLELTGIMSGMADTLSTTVLWKLYFHDIVTENPFVNLMTELNPNGIEISDGVFMKNLNECTVLDCIELVKALVSAQSALGA